MRHHKLKPLLLAASLALLTPCLADAAGLGRLAVLSGLGQPLNAEIELVSVQKGETVAARIATPETYQQANVAYNAVLVGTRITVEKRANGQQFLKAVTPRPVNEPFLELVVELNSEHGRVTRQYTILLDPPGYGRGAAEVPPPVAAPATRPPSTTATEPAVTAPLTSTPAPAAPVATPDVEPSPAAKATPAPRPSTRAESTSASAPVPTPTSSNQYGPVKPGETLTHIARSVKPEGVTLEQTLVGLYRQNPDAFIKKNMNLVKSGKILKVPDASEFAAVGQADAAREIHVQVADFNALRGKLAERAAPAREEGSVTSGRIGARVAEPGATEPRDTVRLSKGEPPSGKAARTGSTADRVRALEEEAVVREKALAEANERIAQLEKTIKDMQRLVELKSSGPPATTKGAEKSAVASQPAAPAKKAETTVVVPPPPVSPSKTPESPTKSAAAKPTAVDTAKDTSTTAATKAVPPNAAKSEVPPAAAKTDTAAKAAKSESPKSDAPSKVAKAKAPTPPPEPEPDLLETIMNEPLYIAAAGAAILLGGVGFVMARRRRKPDNELKEDDDLIKIAPIMGAGASAAAATTSEKVEEPAPAPVTVVNTEPASSETAQASEAASERSGDNDLDFGGATRGARSAAKLPETEPAAEVADVNASAASVDAVPDSSTALHVAEKVEPAVHASSPDLRVAREPKAEEAAPVIDLGLDGTPAPSETATADANASKPARTPEQALADFRRNSAASLQTDESSAAAPGEDKLDSLLADFDLDAVPAASKGSTETGKAAADSNLLDFNLDSLPAAEPSVDAILGDKVVGSGETALEDFKLDDLNLNFGNDPVARGTAKDDHWYDVQQKFDLAKAYEEMGDKEGARDILQEVVKEGDQEQQTQAKKLLGALS